MRWEQEREIYDGGRSKKAGRRRDGLREDVKERQGETKKKR